MFHQFITRTQTVPPPIPLFWYGVMMLLLVLCIYGAFAYHKNPRFVYLFKGIQILQLLVLYSWYVGFGIPFCMLVLAFPFLIAFLFIIAVWRCLRWFSCQINGGASNILPS